MTTGPGAGVAQPAWHDAIKGLWRTAWDALDLADAEDDVPDDTGP
jgi:hypothetical protein